MQRCTPLFNFFAARNLCTTQTASDSHFNSFCTHSQSRGDRHFNRSFIINSILNLLRNSISYNCCVQFRTAYFKNIDLNIFFPSQFFQFFFDAIYFTTTLSDDNSWLRSMDRDDQFIQRAFYYNFRNATFIDTGVQVGSDPVVFNQFFTIIFWICKPVTVPSADDSQPVPNRIYFLTHYSVFIYLYFCLLIPFQPFPLKVLLF